jgi:hypothetical protein
MLAFFGSSDIGNDNIYDLLILNGVFIVSCIFGISLAIRPGWYRRSTKDQNHNVKRKQGQDITRKRKGHHPDCNQFQNHTIVISNKTICAGCFGLSIGCIISIFLMIFYIFVAHGIFSNTFYFLIFLGLIIIGLVYAEILLSRRYAIVHIISNAFLVVSFFLITISIFEITGKMIYGLISILLLFLLLYTRIQLSTYRHSLICNKCNKECKMY